ncbi:MAG: glutaredoxin 3 [Deltaproteobacteria bacterium RIFCSPLOWO2_12_55_13]|nr:MAG: glutaredoxin 3 [Deltaproteobacteria bacterium RIFCSPLOWO2_12_55_13]OGQ93542.1 MAG: glutaredoxin 3 [Deltaproteobacteria bacterium RIFOXYA2_FULL_55_11]HBA39917.1 glutaredoxin 3 [Deltaproteobacteria bacterium]HLD29855.1 glutaredoxin 3 [bacterium]
MPKVVIYTTTSCPYCTRAKAFLRSKNVDFEEIDVSRDERLQEEIIRLSGRRTVPQIFINGKSVGGFDDIRQMDATGDLDRLLEISS